MGSAPGDGLGRRLRISARGDHHARHCSTVRTQAGQLGEGKGVCGTGSRIWPGDVGTHSAGEGTECQGEELRRIQALRWDSSAEVVGLVKMAVTLPVRMRVWLGSGGGVGVLVL